LKVSQLLVLIPMAEHCTNRYCGVYLLESFAKTAFNSIHGVTRSLLLWISWLKVAASDFP